MNPFWSSTVASVRAVASRPISRLIPAAATILCLWAFPAAGAPPANDNRASAIVLPTPAAGRTTGSNVDATKEVGEPNHAGNVGGKSIWFSYTTTSAVSTRIDTVGTGFDTIIAIYRDVGGTLTLVAASDNLQGGVIYQRGSGGYTESRASWTPSSGLTYLIAVDGFNSGTGAISGPIVLNWNQALATAPANDSFASPTVLTGSIGGFSGRNHNAGKQGGEPVIDDPFVAQDSPGGRSVWYRWTPTISGNAVIDTMGSSMDTLLGVFTGNSLNSLTQVAGTDDYNPLVYHGRLTFDAVAGTTYSIAVDGFALAEQGSVALHYYLSSGAPANDAFSSSMALVGTRGSVSGSSLNATKELGEPNHAGDAGGRSVWYHWQAPVDGTVTVSTLGVVYDSLLSVYTGSDMASLTELGNSDDLLGGVIPVSRVSFNATAGTTYRIAVDGFAGDYGVFSLNWDQAVNAPTNDLFAGAMNLPGRSGTVTTSNTNAVYEQGEPFVAVIGTTIFLPTVGGKSLWFKWTAPSTRPITFDTLGSSFDTTLAICTGPDLLGLGVLANNDNIIENNILVSLQSRIVLDAIEGTSYFIQVDGVNLCNNRLTDNGSVVLNYSQPGGAPPNDNFADAFILTGFSGTTNGSSLDATTEIDEPDRGVIPPNTSSWYRWTAPTSGWFTFDTLGGPLDTVLAIYTGTEFSNFVEVGSNNNIDDGIPILQSRVTFLASGGVTYNIAVDGAFGAQDDFTLNWAPTAILKVEVVGGNLLLTLTVADGDMYTIQQSTDLVNWGDVETVSAGGGPVTRDLGPIAGIPKKFYKAIQVP